MSTTAAGRHARSGLDQLDVAEDLVACVAAAVAVVVERQGPNAADQRSPHNLISSRLPTRVRNCVTSRRNIQTVTDVAHQEPRPD